MKTPMPVELSRLRLEGTPRLILLRDALERNLARMQRLCDQAGVALRAHGKMHKCSALAKLQVQAGAVGVCAQTVQEAEAFVRAGIGDVLVTAPPPLWAAQALAALSARARVAAVVDDLRLAEALGRAADAAGRALEVLVDVDLGQHRTGVAPEDALPLAMALRGLRGVRFAGVQGYGGHLQHIVDAKAREAASLDARRRLAGVVDALRAAGLEPGQVTGGGTGTHAGDLKSGVFTELQAGSYAVMDVEYGDCEGPDGAAWPFEPALFVAATVVSARHRTHVVVDAGLKAVSVDGPRARVAAGAAPGSIWRPMGDEHGGIFSPAGLEALKAVGAEASGFARAVAEANLRLPPNAEAPRLGDLVWLQPGHCDPTVNLYDAFEVLEADGSWGRWPIDARRSSRG